MGSRIKKYQELSKDIEGEIFEVDVEKIKNGEYEIESIIDVFLDPKDLPIKLQESGVGVNTDLSVKEVKRGDTIYITAFLRKPGMSLASPAVQGVLKLRVVDMFYGLQHLNKALNNRL